MRIRRRFKRIVTWLPNIQRNVEPSDNTPVNLSFGTIAIDERGVSTTAVQALVRDQNPTLTTDNVLADYTQGGYRLDRVVGKFYCGMEQKVAEPATDILPSTFLTASLEILKVDPNTNQPVGVANLSNYDLTAPGNERDPWIWQRTWLLSNGNAQNFTLPWAYGPYTNAEYGSVLDGPHVDAKTRRRVGPEERLFLIVTTFTAWDYTVATPTIDPGAAWWMFQYRALGSPLKTSNRRNASR